MEASTLNHHLHNTSTAAAHSLCCKYTSSTGQAQQLRYGSDTWDKLKEQRGWKATLPSTMVGLQLEMHLSKGAQHHKNNQVNS